MRTYYDIASALKPGWKLPYRLSVKRNVTSERTPYFGKTDIVTAYIGGLKPDPRKWSVPPHVQLANLSYSDVAYTDHEKAAQESSKAFLAASGSEPLEKIFKSSLEHQYTGSTPSLEKVSKFIARYGILFNDESGLADGPVEISIAEFRDLQERLRDAWRRADAKPLWFAVGGENLDNFDLPFTWGGNNLVLRPADCWTYIRLLLTRDLSAGRAIICAYPACPTPFCVKERSDSKVLHA